MAWSTLDNRTLRQTPSAGSLLISHSDDMLLRTSGKASSSAENYVDASWYTVRILNPTVFVVIHSLRSAGCRQAFMANPIVTYRSDSSARLRT